MSVSAQQILEDLVRVLDDVDELLESAAPSRTSDADVHEPGRHEVFERVRGKVHSMRKALTAQAHQRAAAVDGYFRKNTWKTVAAAAGVAFIAGLIAGRPSRDSRD